MLPATRSPRPLEHLRGRAVVTVDMDGTFYDPWHCCGRRGTGFVGDRDCTHLRADVVAQVQDACRRHDAVAVVLSWRAGLTDTTIKWLADCNIASPTTRDIVRNPDLHFEAVFIPGAPDDPTTPESAGRSSKSPAASGQVGFKSEVLDILTRALGCTVVASFDDSAPVIAAAADRGVLEPTLVPHLVQVKPWEWAAGFIGAPRTSPAATASQAQPALFDDVDPHDAWDRWGDEEPLFGEGDYVYVDVGNGLEEAAVRAFDEEMAVVELVDSGEYIWVEVDEVEPVV